MAKSIRLENPATGQVKTGYYGYSWTTLFFGPFPALFRMDFITFIGFFVIWLILAVLTGGILAIFVSIAWSFMYNKYYTNNLIKNGFMLAGSKEDNREASEKIGVMLTQQNSKQTY